MRATEHDSDTRREPSGRRVSRWRSRRPAPSARRRHRAGRDRRSTGYRRSGPAGRAPTATRRADPTCDQVATVDPARRRLCLRGNVETTTGARSPSSGSAATTCRWRPHDVVRTPRRGLFCSVIRHPGADRPSGAPADAPTATLGPVRDWSLLDRRGQTTVQVSPPLISAASRRAGRRRRRRGGARPGRAPGRRTSAARPGGRSRSATGGGSRRR